MPPRPQSHSRFFNIPGTNKFFLLGEFQYSFNNMAWIFDAGSCRAPLRSMFPTAFFDTHGFACGNGTTDKEEWYDVQLTGPEIMHLQSTFATALGRYIYVYIDEAAAQQLRSLGSTKCGLQIINMETFECAELLPRFNVRKLIAIAPHASLRFADLAPRMTVNCRAKTLIGWRGSNCLGTSCTTSTTNF
jgi:hypothetical protein